MSGKKDRQPKYNWSGYWNDELRYGIALVFSILTFIGLLIGIMVAPGLVKLYFAAPIIIGLLVFLIIVMWPDKL